MGLGLGFAGGAVQKSFLVVFLRVGLRTPSSKATILSLRHRVDDLNWIVKLHVCGQACALAPRRDAAYCAVNDLCAWIDITVEHNRDV